MRFSKPYEEFKLNNRKIPCNMGNIIPAGGLI
jgi:hypothetical protein